MKDKLFTRFFKSNHLEISTKGCMYDESTTGKIRKLCVKNNIELIQTQSKKNLYRGVCVEHYLGSKDRPGLGLVAMRAGLARYLMAKKINLAELEPSDIDDMVRKHVLGFSKGGNTKDKANSFTRSPYIAAGFGLDSSLATKYPLLTIITATPVHDNFLNWPVAYDESLSYYEYQLESLVPFETLPLQNVALIKRHKNDFLHVNDLVNAKNYPSSLFSDELAQSFIQSTQFTDYVHSYQELEVKKVIAFDDLVRYSSSEIKDNLKACELFQAYNSIRSEQVNLINFPLDEKSRWIEIASAIAPLSYNVIDADELGIKVKLPIVDGSEIIEIFSNLDASLLFAPLLEADPSLTLEQIKNGEVPAALNYMVENTIRKYKTQVDLSALENSIEDEKRFKMTM
ncbi:MAG: hypothetical protein H0U57_02210 [Tatlockia sp.]|nr:hypothetical protein [Tatlockia sp.]